jgi:hypothetical protein
MHQMRTVCAAVAIIGLLAVLASAGDLATYKATYDQQIEVIVLSHGGQMMELSKEYSKALESLLNKVKAAGDLDKTKAVMAEIARFDKGPAMPGAPAVNLDVKNLQSVYRTRATIYNSDKARKIVGLVTKYDEALAGLQKKLVAASKLDEAESVQKERQAVKVSDVYTQAKAGMTAASTSVPAAAPAVNNAYTLTVTLKTGSGKYDDSNGSDHVHMNVFLNSDSERKKALSGRFPRGSTRTFEGIQFDTPLSEIKSVSLLCSGGGNSWGMESVTFQFFARTKKSKAYTFGRTAFSADKNDTATTLKAYPIPGGVKLNIVHLGK